MENKQVERFVSECGDWIHVSALEQIRKVTIKFSKMTALSRLKVAYAAAVGADCDINLVEQTEREGR